MRLFLTLRGSFPFVLSFFAVTFGLYATPFQNGSFEAPLVSPGGHPFPTGSADIAGWTIGGSGQVDIINGPGEAAGTVVGPVDGAQQIGFNSGDTVPGATLSQVFDTLVGQTYRVAFYVGRVGVAGGTMSLLARATSSSGDVLGSMTAVAPASAGYGPLQTFTFTASTPSSILTFLDTSTVTIAVDLLLDNVTVTPLFQCVPATAGLIGWWKGDGNADDATGTNNGTPTDVSFINGEVGQCFYFNGTDSQISLGNSVGNFGTNDFTIEFWISTTATRHESVIEKWPTCGYASMWAIRIGSVAPWSGPGRLEAEMYSDLAGSDKNAISAGRPINDGLFHHVALVRRGTSLVFYIDGVLDVATSVLSGSISRINNTANLTVGKRVCVGLDGTSPFTGQMDEISF